MLSRKLRPTVLGLIAGLLAAAADGPPATGTDGGFRQHDAGRPKPPVVEPAADPARPPKDAVVLFDGRSLDAWSGEGGGPAKWKVADDAFEIVPGEGAIRTKAEFGDVQLHVEWASPSPPEGKGQDRGNTGLFLMGLYELQILDSHRADTYADGQAGAIYGQHPPLSNASKPPGEWQTYDVAFRRPRFDQEGKLLEPARVTLFHNGILVQNNEELLGRTTWLKWTPYEAHADKGPIELQDHGHPARFRNVWLRELPDRPAPTPEQAARPAVVAMSAESLDRFVGSYAMGTKPDAPKVQITRGEGKLLVKFPFLPKPLELVPTAPTEFAMPHTDGRFTFQVDAQGRVAGALFQVGDGERTLRRVER